MTAVIKSSMSIFTAINKTLVGLVVLATLGSGQNVRAAGMSSVDYEAWIASQAQQSIVRMMANIHPAGTAAGVVIASPQRDTPNYYYFWVRDAALTMSTIFDLYHYADQLGDGPTRDQLRGLLMNYAQFSRINQLTATLGGIGEPKYNVDGSRYAENWCRPQNDGPALRAITLMRFANQLLDQGEAALVRAQFYDSQLPTSTVIKEDLEFVSNHWNDVSCDIWEEVAGDHFYTRLVQRRSLVEGAAFATRLGDANAAAWYQSQADALATQILQHWNANLGVFVPTLNWQSGIAYKSSQLDSQVLLGILHSGGFLFSDVRVQSTMRMLSSRFQSLYRINNFSGVPGVAIGRYPEDTYDGNQFRGGNAWVLITAAFANAHYRAANELLTSGQRDQAVAEFNLGETYLRRLQYHANPDGSLSEQLQRDSGYMTSARDLTWSHVEFLQAAWTRSAVKNALQQQGNLKGPAMRLSLSHDQDVIASLNLNAKALLVR